MRLVIAEKPSVAQSIAAVLGANSRKDGYLKERMSGFRCVDILWSFSGGCLRRRYSKWRFEDCRSFGALEVPGTQDKQKQFKILKSLMGLSSDGDCLRHGCRARRADLPFGLSPGGCETGEAPLDQLHGGSGHQRRLQETKAQRGIRFALSICPAGRRRLAGWY